MPEVPDTQAFLDPDASREYLRSWQENVDRAAARAAAIAEQAVHVRRCYYVRPSAGIDREMPVGSSTHPH